MHDSVLALLNRVRRANFGAGRVVAVPADIGRRGGRLTPVDEVEIDHGVSAVRLALLAGLETRLAADATRRVDVKLQSEHQALSWAFRSRQADTLNSGILLCGSRVR